MQSASPNLLALTRRRNHLGSFSYLATVLAAQAFDLLIGHGRGAVRVEKLPRVAGAEVVLQGPDAGGEIHARIAKPGLADVDQSTELAVCDQHVGQAVVPVSEDVSKLCHAERAACRVGRMNTAQDRAEQAGERERPATRWSGGTAGLRRFHVS